MAIKKSQLYSTLWTACDALRGGMDASQYKDYVLVVLFLKYISDKAKSDPDTLIEVPEGCTFTDILALCNKSNIGEEMNKILEKIAAANNLQGVITNADFSDENKLGKGKDLVDTVTKLIKVFDNENLDFSNNRAADDDLIGDAYEYLMRNFASQSGKSKGQFYTPAEVSRVMANIIGINKDDRPMISIYDPTCGSGSLLLRARGEARHNASIDGQEKDLATIGMAKMSMIIHGVDDAELVHGDTLNNPLHRLNDNELQQFNYVVANPPFSLKQWMKSAKENDDYSRWGHGDGIAPVPPNGCGDYAFLLHIVASLDSNGHGACILPHGVLFRGGAESEIREFLVKKKLISGIIGLPTNLFFGTGIPACIIIIDKEHAFNSQGIFMIDAKGGFEKDGAKNRLREMDIRRIEDVWEAHNDVPYYARFVPFEEIERNGYNLNIPRYVTPEDNEVIQDITAHLKGGLPCHDVDEVLAHYWDACPSLKADLFGQANGGYYRLQVATNHIAEAIDGNGSYQELAKSYLDGLHKFFDMVKPQMEALAIGFNPKAEITKWAQSLLDATSDQMLVNPYDVYEILMNYWAETMQDDCYMVSRDGWKLTWEATKKNATYEQIVCDLLPVEVLLNVYFKKELDAVRQARAAIENIQASADQLVEDNPEAFGDFFEKVNESNVKKETNAFKKGNSDGTDEMNKLWFEYLAICQKKKEASKIEKQLVELLTQLVIEKYNDITADEIKDVVINHKWCETLMERASAELSRVNHQMATDVIALVNRYATTLPEIDNRVKELRNKVNTHLAAMGIASIKEAESLLTGEKRISGFTDEWVEKEIGQIGYTYSGITGKNKNDFGHGNAQYITFLNVLNNPIIDTSIFERVDIKPTEGQNAAKKGDLFFNTSSETPEEVGICAVLDKDIDNLYLNSFCFGYRLTDDSVLGLYLAYFWRSKQGREIMATLAQGATRYNLSKAYFNKVRIKLPKTVEEQRAIVSVLNSMDDLIAALDCEREKYTLIKQGMMQELLTGKSRLI